MIGGTMNTPDMGFHGLRMIQSDEIEIHWRADKWPRPKVFYMEPGARRHDGGAHLDITRYHQVDPSRPLTLAGIMPNLELLKRAANPYPTGPGDPVIQGHMTWAPYVEVSHAYWLALSQAEGPLTGVDIALAAIPHIPRSTAQRILDIEHSRVGRDTLRDLRLYGLIASDGYREDVWSTVWAIADDVWHDVPPRHAKPEAAPRPAEGP